MTLGHEKLGVYRLSIDYVAWVYEKDGKLEEQAAYGTGKNAFEPDGDFDVDKERPQPRIPGYA